MSACVGRRAGGSLLVLAAIFIVGVWLQPATAHIDTPGHLWRTHLRPLADTRYLQNSNVYASALFTLGPGADLTVDRLCPAGMQALGGGVEFAAGPGADVDFTSAPLVASDDLLNADPGKNPRSNGWSVKMHNNQGAATFNGVVGAICSR